MNKFLLGLVTVLFSSLGHASAWVQVTGSALIQEGLYEQARVSARDDALRQAVMEFGASVTSEQLSLDGTVLKDEVRIDAQAKVKRSVIKDEYISGDTLFVVMNVELEQLASCPNSSAQKYRKSLALLRFSSQMPNQSSYGKMGDVGLGLSMALKTKLNEYDHILMRADLNHVYYEDVISAPTRTQSELRLTNTAMLSEQYGAQFIVSGVVRDMGFEDISSQDNSVWQSLLNFSRISNRNRRFVMDVYLHDGLTGSLIWSDRYQTSEEWTADREEQVGFGSPQFWETEYGRAVHQQLALVAYQLNDQLKCQPFMTRISRVEGRNLYFDNGARSGVKPGDKLSLYRSYRYVDANNSKGFELQNVNTALTVSQVHPDFASGSISIDPGRINIQEDDLLIAW